MSHWTLLGAYPSQLTWHITDTDVVKFGNPSFISYTLGPLGDLDVLYVFPLYSTVIVEPDVKSFPVLISNILIYIL